MKLSDLFPGLARRSAVNTWTPAHPVTVASVEGWEAATPAAAENLAVVLSCINVIASNIASFPVLVYRRDGNARVEVLDHWFTRVMREGPGPYQTWGALVESAVASVELHGNALVEIIRDGDAITGFRFLPWGWVTVQLLPGGRMAFDVYEPVMPGAGAVKRRLLAADVLHLKDRSDDGLVGRSRLSRARDVFLTATSQQTFARTFLERGAQPSGVISLDAPLTPQQRDQIRLSFNEGHVGAGKAGRALILDDGMKWEAMQVSPEDAELLGSRRFAVEEIARIYGVPPPMVGDLSHGTFTNSREAARWFGQFTLTPRVRRLEAELNRALFGAGSPFEVEFDMSSLLRSDPETRWASHKIAVETGVLDTDEIRQIEGWNPRAVTDG
ncbi:phage portal protein [uncultured Sphingomonas sp.]|uniref:phage portal protein n=1 Tax=uncultured Sphingomonas sp. TaxID=158754 RepID=UPI0035CB8443